VVAGLSGLGRPLGADWVHRPELFSSLSGLNAGESIRTRDLVRVLASPLGGLKSIPPAARRLALLNQADSDELRAAGGRMAQDLLGAYETILVASLKENSDDSVVSAAYRRIAGVILAAGGSARLGRPKALLEWRKQPFVRSVAETALAAGLDPVCIVTGEFDAPIRQAVEGLDVQIVPNPQWQTGQAGSIKAGLHALPGGTGAAIFLLVDQPQLPAGFLRAEMELHRQTLAPLIIPQVDGRRANPVLFDYATFGELDKIEGDSGGRQIFGHFPVQWLPWNDSALLLDVDTPEDYRRLLELE
jgi:molybdenum cofactor cytidylyltransferase